MEHLVSRSEVTYPTDGVTDVFTIPFEYIDGKHIGVTLDDAPVPFEFLSQSSVHVLTEAPPDKGSRVRIKRTTPGDAPLAKFETLSRGLRDQLNLNARQLLFLVQEAVDALDQ